MSEGMDYRGFAKILSSNRTFREERVIASLEHYGSGQATPCRVTANDESPLE